MGSDFLRHEGFSGDQRFSFLDTRRYLTDVYAYEAFKSHNFTAFDHNNHTIVDAQEEEAIAALLQMESWFSKLHFLLWWWVLFLI